MFSGTTSSPPSRVTRGSSSTPLVSSQRRLRHASRPTSTTSVLSGQTTPRASRVDRVHDYYHHHNKRHDDHDTQRGLVINDTLTGNDVKPHSTTTDRTLVKHDHYVAIQQDTIPFELKHAIVQADTYTQPFRATLDTNTGFALLVSRQACHVWNWAKPSSATVYTFPIQQQDDVTTSVSALIPLAFALLVPSTATTTTTNKKTTTSSSSSQQQQQQQREPGLITVTSTGTIRLWESISMSLSGVDKFKQIQTELNQQEVVKGIQKISSTCFVLFTSHARLFNVGIVYVRGKANLDVSLLDKPVGWATSVWSSVFRGNQHNKIDPTAGFKLLTVEPNSSTTTTTTTTTTTQGLKTIYALSDKNCQIWQLPTRGGEGGERLLADVDVFASLVQAVKGTTKITNQDWAINNDKVEILDACALTTPGHLAILVSHQSTTGNDRSQSFSIITIAITSSTMTVDIVDSKRLTHQALPDPRPLSTPKLSIQGHVAFVTFVDVVVALSLERDSTFQEKFSLRSNEQRFLGFSIFKETIETHFETNMNSISLLTSMGKILLIQIQNLNQIKFIQDRFNKDEFKTNQLKIKIEQSIYFDNSGGSDLNSNESSTTNDNPLMFVVEPDVEGDVVIASQSVSSQLLSSSSPLQPLILDLRTQLNDRIQKSKALIEFIGSNGLLPRLSQTARRQLIWDAERLQGAFALWNKHNSKSSDNVNLLNEAINRYMAEIGQSLNEDPVRTFFRTKVASLGDVLERVSVEAKLRLSNLSTSEERSFVLHEANEIYVTVLKAVFKFRQQQSIHYGISPTTCPTEPWTSRLNLLQKLSWQFESTEESLKQFDRELGSTTTTITTMNQQEIQIELKNQMIDLAQFLFSGFEERILFLTSSNVDGEASIEVRSIKDTYFELRPRLIHTLVQIGKITEAYDLAERHQDFKVLVQLCNHSKHGSSKRIEYFLNKYQELFAFDLFEFYIDNGMFEILFNLDSKHVNLLTRFLDESDNDQIAWLNDIEIGRFNHAKSTLLNIANQETLVQQQKLMLSLGKLTQVAQVTSSTLNDEPVQRAIQVIDDQLDLVNTQSTLRETLTELLSGNESRLNVFDQAKIVSNKITMGLKNQPIQQKMIHVIVERLFQGFVICSEDLIDLLSCKDNTGQEQFDDFTTALEVVVRAQTLPEARKQIALETIWRRIYLRDDWNIIHQTSNLTDSELSNILRQTYVYKTLFSISNVGVELSNLFLQPKQCEFELKQGDELKARFLDESSAFNSLLQQQQQQVDQDTNIDIDQLENEFKQSNERLLNFINNDGLQGYVDEIVRLVKVDQEQGRTRLIQGHESDDDDAVMVE
ncbi:hypothetical protein OIO90_000245 [Microbotryomycetes sp. JL221]|nr:hypothetical protein OIO90_000245 [Microbotryomycetes sp. JL221]